MTPAWHVAVLGCGAIGSWLEAACPDGDLALTFVDHDVVADENLGVAAYESEDVGRSKTAILAHRRRARGGVALRLDGDVRWVVRPGLVDALDAIVLALDNPAAVTDAAAAAWAGARSGLPVVTLTCGGAERPGWLARLFVTPGRCPACAFGRAERGAAVAGLRGLGCAATSAPRASAGSAAAAGAAGARLLERWRAGDRALAGCRIQDDGGGEFVAAMPTAPSPHCAVGHGGTVPVIDLGAGVTALTVGMLAERALACGGDDAVIALVRRSVPLGGLYCPACQAHWGSPPLLLPAALARPRPACDCPMPPRPLGQRTELSPGELLGLEHGDLRLADWGAAPGDEFLVKGDAGRVRLRCRFSWSELDA